MPGPRHRQRPASSPGYATAVPSRFLTPDGVTDRDLPVEVDRSMRRSPRSSSASPWRCSKGSFAAVACTMDRPVVEARVVDLTCRGALLERR